MIAFRPIAKLDKKLAIILLDEEQVKKRSFAINNNAVKKEIVSLHQADLFTAKNGSLFPIAHRGKTILLVGLGKIKDESTTSLRIAVRGAILSTYAKSAKEIEVVPNNQDDETVKTIIEGILIGSYTWDKYQTKEGKEASQSKKFFLIAAKKKSLDETIAVCDGVRLTRDLVNENADIVTSSFLEESIREIIKGQKNVSLAVLNKKELKAKKLNLILAVNQASINEPKLIIVKYTGATKKSPYTAIVGKGITFDSGGMNLKTSGHIETMRLDMSGTAAVMGALKNAIALKLKKNIIFTMAIAENSIGPGAYKPGDIIRSYSGKTVEVGNTDAEGRLVLADAISYIIKNYKPAKLIDIATLTGACIIALGLDYTGLVSTDDKFANNLIQSSEATDDRVWRLPMYKELKDSVKSKMADIRNLGLPKGAGGTITAAEFLRQFTEDTPWAHLDIAGTSFVDSAERLYYSHGGTGAGVRLLTHYLQNYG